MKSKVLFIFIFSSTLLFFSCDKDSKKQISSDSQIQNEAELQSDIDSENQEVQKKSPSDKIDLDLTGMTKTMIYSTVFDMVVNPEDYLGKNIRVEGKFQVFEGDNSDEKYFAVIIPDATACCQQGMEFIWEGNHIYPDDYPMPGEWATITGRYDIIEIEDGISYAYLKASDVQF